MPDATRAALHLAIAMLAGGWSAREMVDRLAEAWEGRERWHRPLVGRVRKRFGAERSGLDRATLAAFVLEDRGFRQAWAEHLASQPEAAGTSEAAEPVADQETPPPAMRWGVPVLRTPGALADWLGLTVGRLEWLADCRRLQGREADAARHHYSYRWIAGRGGRVRLLEAPKGLLKAAQRRIVRGILDLIPPHEGAHGFRRGRSILSCVAPHCGQPVVLRLDLRQFFTSIPASRVHALYRKAGYDPAVARLLTGLCTHAVPEEVLRGQPRGPWDGPPRLDAALLSRHLPQGAPPSPALANLCAYRLDCRLAGLAGELGAAYTRYADDLVFSGGQSLQEARRRLHVLVARIALEEGFEVNTHKTRVMGQAVRQQALGLVLNARPNVARADYDRLKAILTNCVRHGLASQNRQGLADFRGHLSGRIGYVEQVHPARGRRLRELFDRIAWAGGEAGGQS